MELRPDHYVRLDDLNLGGNPSNEDDNPHNGPPADFDIEAMLEKLGGRPPEIMSADEVREETSRRSRNIFENFEKLGAILDRHEATIQKRWTKKTKEQKRKIILKAWGDDRLDVLHRPDFEAFTKESERDRETGTKFRDAYVWPHINQEDLVKPKTLLLFLNSRGRNYPCDFASADFDATHLGRVSKAVDFPFLNLHSMMLNNRKTPESYGELYNWTDQPESLEWLLSRKSAQPGEGLLILEIQDRTLEFLVRCCQEILHDFPPDTLLNAPVQVEPELPADRDSGFDSLTVMTAEAPYRVPGKLSFRRIESLLAAKRDAVADHIWALREDPGLFAESIMESREHVIERLPDPYGGLLFDTWTEEKNYGVMLKNDIASLYIQLERWTELHQQARKLRQMQEETYSDGFDPQDDLPDEYMSAILRFRFYLNESAREPLRSLSTRFLSSPPIRHYVQVWRTPERGPTAISSGLKPGVRLGRNEDRLYWLIQTLAKDDKTLFFIGMNLIVDELQRLIESEPKVKALITSMVAAIIADLSIICECLRQLELYKPWSNSYIHHLIDKEAGIKEEYAQRTKPWAAIQQALASKGPSLSRLGAPTDRRFDYPISRRRTRENVEKLRAAEANLDTFWNHVDNTLLREAGDLGGTALRRLLTEPRVLHRTPEWIDDAPKKPTRETLAVDTVRRPLSDIYFDLERRTERTVRRDEIAAEEKTKHKTRGTATTIQQTQQDDQPNPSDPQPTFAVDARALKDFRTLFYTPSTNATPGEVPWTDFLHAMVSTGFRPEKLYGSVWQFSPTNLDVERSIQFHEPHPNSKMPYWVARRHGRRLNRAYGWHGEMFVLAEKQREA